MDASVELSYKSGIASTVSKVPFIRDSLKFSLDPAANIKWIFCGEARAPNIKHLLDLARKDDIADKTANQTIDRIATVAEQFCDFAEDWPIRAETLESMAEVVHSNRLRLIQRS